MDDLRQKQDQAIGRAVDAGTRHAHQPHPRIGQRIADAELAHGFARSALRRQLRHQPVFLVGFQPRRGCRRIRQQQVKGHAQRHGRQRLQDEQPLPSRQPCRAIQRQYRLGDQRARHDRKGRRQDQQGQHPHAIAAGKPLRADVQQPRVKPSLAHAQDEAHQIERLRPGDQGIAQRSQRPADHDDGNPYPRTDARQDQVRRHAEGDIARKEQPRCQAILRGRQPQRLVHGQRREADIHPVDIGGEIGSEQKRQDPPGNRAHGGRFGRGGAQCQKGRARRNFW